MKIKVVNGELVINVYDLLDELTREDEADPEQLEQMYQSLQWYHPVYLELIKTTRTQHVGENYNPDFFKLFKDFFTLPGDWWEGGYGEELKRNEVMRCMTYAMKSILQENAKLRSHLYLVGNLGFRLEEWLKWLLGEEEEDLAYQIRSKVNELLRTEKDGRNLYEIAGELANSVEYKDWVEEWCQSVYDKFDKESEE